MSIELNLAVMWDNGKPWEVQPCEATTCEDASKEWESDVVRVCRIVLEDEETPVRSGYSHMESAYNAIASLDAAYDCPVIQDMIMHFFKKGFEEGMSYQAAQAESQATQR